NDGADGEPTKSQHRSKSARKAHAPRSPPQTTPPNDGADGEPTKSQHRSKSARKAHAPRSPPQTTPPATPECGAPQFTLCAEPRHEFFYHAEAGTCSMVKQAVSSSCNRSPNRFASLRSCRSSCVAAIMPAQRCFDKPVFAGCSRNLVVSTWWFFDGHRCVQWQFPAGQCPIPGQAFRSRAQCQRQCTGRRHFDSRKPAQRCRRPARQTCSSQQLRFPYMAHMFHNGRIQCLQISAPAVLKQRCLVGPNRFRSLARCRAVCVRRLHRTPPMSPHRVTHGRRRPGRRLRRANPRGTDSVPTY
ncbi:hypothetical protein MTO96_029266, partial [Rhipicephalus appendiculatus]